MKAWRAGLLSLVVGSVCGAGCSSATGSATQVELRGTYTAAGPGAYLQMTFYDAEHFFLFRSPCDVGDPTSANECMESGTYALDTGRGLLALRDVKTGDITQLPFSLDDATPSLASLPLHVLGGSVSLTGSASLTSGSDASLTSGKADAGLTVVADSGLTVGKGGTLSYGDGGALTSEAGVPLVKGFTAGGQPFQGSTPDGGTGSTVSSGASQGTGAGSSAHASGGSPSQGGASSGAGGSPANGGSPAGGSPMSGGSSTSSSEAPGASGGTTSINLLYEGSCSFLKKCDSYSKSAPAGDVVFGCTGTTACTDSLPYVAGPDKSYCGKVVTFCTSSGVCTNGKVMDTSNVQGWEGGVAVMKGLQMKYGDGTCSNGGYGGGTVTVTQ